jgi:hypothetical protein
MNDLIQLTDAEIAGVSGGILNQSNTITTTNSATVTQTSTAATPGRSPRPSQPTVAPPLSATAAPGAAGPQPRQALSQAIIRWWFRRTTSQRATTNVSISASDNLMLWPISFWADRR